MDLLTREEIEKTGEPYCYGCNDVHLNLYYAETGNRWQVFQQTIIPPEVWAKANQIFGKLLLEIQK